MRAGQYEKREKSSPETRKGERRRKKGERKEGIRKKRRRWHKFREHREEQTILTKRVFSDVENKGRKNNVKKLKWGVDFISRGVNFTPLIKLLSGTLRLVFFDSIFSHTFLREREKKTFFSFCSSFHLTGLQVTENEIWRFWVLFERSVLLRWFWYDVIPRNGPKSDEDFQSLMILVNWVIPKMGMSDKESHSLMFLMSWVIDFTEFSELREI